MIVSSVPATVDSGIHVPGTTTDPELVPTTQVCVGGPGGDGDRVIVFLSVHDERVMTYILDKLPTHE